MEPSLTPSGTQAIIDKLRGAQPWLRFIGIMCWIGTGVMMLLAALLLLLAASNNTTDPDLHPVKMFMASVVYGALSLLYVYPAILLLRAARHIRNLGTDIHDIVEAIDAQRRLWKYIGIYLIVAISLCILVIGLAVLFAIGRAVNA